jgi:hypothetical protein
MAKLIEAASFSIVGWLNKPRAPFGGGGSVREWEQPAYPERPISQIAETERIARFGTPAAGERAVNFLDSAAETTSIVEPLTSAISVS